MAHLKSDWENREFTQNAQYNILKIATFLNKADSSARYQLASLNEKLTTLERQVEYLESSVRTAIEAPSAQPQQ